MQVLSIARWAIYLYIVIFLQLYVPDEDKSIYGRSVNKQVFESLTTSLLQIVATILESLWPHISEPGYSNKTRIASPDQVKSQVVESYNSRVQDLIRYYSYNTFYTVSSLM